MEQWLSEMEQNLLSWLSSWLSENHLSWINEHLAEIVIIIVITVVVIIWFILSSIYSSRKLKKRAESLKKFNPQIQFHSLILLIGGTIFVIVLIIAGAVLELPVIIPSPNDTTYLPTKDGKDSSGTVAYNKGVANEYLGKYQRAIEDYSQAIRLDPNNVDAYHSRGGVYEKLGKYQRAIEDYNQTIRLYPNNAKGYNSRGIAYYMLGELERACSDYQKACELGLCKRFNSAKKKGDCVETIRDDRFVAHRKGIVFDKKTGLEWIVGPDRAISWYEAKNWMDNLNIDGGGWRMPTLEELKTLYKKGAGMYNITPLLKTTGWWVWSADKSGSYAYLFDFKGGEKSTMQYDCEKDSYNTFRGFAVRSRK